MPSTVRRRLIASLTNVLYLTQNIICAKRYTCVQRRYRVAIENDLFWIVN